MEFAAPKLNRENSNSAASSQQSVLSTIAGQSSSAISSNVIKATVCCPIHSSVTLSIHSDASVLAMKQTISKEHPAHPSLLSQRIIYGGRLLQDSQLLKDIIRKVTKHQNSSNWESINAFFIE